MKQIRRLSGEPRPGLSYFAILLGALFLACAGCGGGGQHAASAASSLNALPQVALSPSPAPVPADGSQPVSVQLSYRLPGAVQTSSAKRARQLYIASGNANITIAVTPLGGSTATTGPTACTTVSCSVNFSTTPGPNTIVFTLTDGSANVLSTFSTTAIVQSSTMNVLSYSSNPVVNSVALTLANPMPNAGTVISDLLTVAAKDADGNTIVGNAPYVDANGNALSLLLSVTNTQAGGRGTVTIQGPLRITSPSQQLTYARYDGNWLDHADITVTPTSTLNGTVLGTTLTTTPHATEYPTAGTPLGITSGPDGNIWSVEFNGNSIDKISTNGTNFKQYSCSPCSFAGYIVPGPDGNLWFADGSGVYVSKISTQGVITRVLSTAAGPLQIIPGPDGALWFSIFNGSGGGGIGWVNPSGTNKYYVNGDSIRAITFGPDGNLWYIDSQGSKIGKMTRQGVYLASWALPTVGVAADGLVTGPDGNLWATNNGSAVIDQVSVNGTITPHALQAGSQPRDIIVGPDGYLWFTEQGKNTIGRMSTTGALTEYTPANGINASSSPIGITIGADGNIWFAESGSNSLAKFIL